MWLSKLVYDQIRIVATEVVEKRWDYKIYTSLHVTLAISWGHRELLRN